MIDHLLKSIAIFIIISILNLGKASAFDTWTLPVESELKTLRVTNLTSQMQMLWLSGPRDLQNDSQETSYQIRPYAMEEIPLLDFKSQPWLRLLSQQNKAFQIQIETSSDTRLLIPTGSLTRWKVRALSGNQLVVYNQAPFEQKIQITSPGHSSQMVDLLAFEKKRLPLAADWNGDMLTISGDARIGGFLITSSGPRAWIPDPAPVQLQTSSLSSYFRLSNKESTQSYIVALQDTQLIEQARKQIISPSTFQPRILVAQVTSGSGEFNRDFTRIPRAPWSWHISQVFRFAELASQDCDGSPELLEETLGPWLSQSGVICFWNYRIVEELSAAQIASGQP